MSRELNCRAACVISAFRHSLGAWAKMWLRCRDVAGAGEMIQQYKSGRVLAYYRLFKMTQLMDILGFPFSSYKAFSFYKVTHDMTSPLPSPPYIRAYW